MLKKLGGIKIIMEYWDGNKVIWKTKHFILLAVENPFFSREEGGHIVIQGYPDKLKYDSRLDLNEKEILEEFTLSQNACKAFKKAMLKAGIDIIRFNFFEAGNWAWKKSTEGVSSKAYFHLHIFGRTIDAKYQKFPEAPYLPDRSTHFYDNFVPLNEEDVRNIQEELSHLENPNI